MNFLQTIMEMFRSQQDQSIVPEPDMSDYELPMTYEPPADAPAPGPDPFQDYN